MEIQIAVYATEVGGGTGEATPWEQAYSGSSYDAALRVFCDLMATGRPARMEGVRLPRLTSGPPRNN